MLMGGKIEYFCHDHWAVPKASISTNLMRVNRCPGPAEGFVAKISKWFLKYANKKSNYKLPWNAGRCHT